MIKSSISISLIFLLLTGCATRSAHEQLQLDYEQLKLAHEQLKANLTTHNQHFNQYKTRSEKRHTGVENEMQLFKEAYNPKLHTLLNKNLNEAKSFHKKILAILKRATKLEKKLEKLSQLSTKNFEITDRNAQSSTAKNVVNEFTDLKAHWRQTISKLKSIARDSQDLAEQAEDSANEARQFAKDAKYKAKNAASDANKVNDLRDELNNLASKISDMKPAIRELKSKNSYEKNEIKRLMELYKDLNEKVRKLDRK